MKKPNNKHSLTLYFDSKQGIDNFIGWYIDGGGEQYSNYYSEDWGKDWIYVKPPQGHCPKCEYWDEDMEFSIFDKCPNMCGYKK